MSDDGLNDAQIVHMQRMWKLASENRPNRPQQNLQYIADIEQSLRYEGGLDLDDDATYALLDPDGDRVPVKADFDRAYIRLRMLNILDKYHEWRSSANEGPVNEASYRKYALLKELVETDLPAFVKKIWEAGENVKPAKPEPRGYFETNEFELIMWTYESSRVFEGKLQVAALETAQESFRNALSARELLDAAGRDPGISRLEIAKRGMHEAGFALELIEETGDFYEPAEIPARYNVTGELGAETAAFSREALEELKGQFEDIVAAEELVLAQEEAEAQALEQRIEQEAQAGYRM